MPGTIERVLELVDGHRRGRGWLLANGLGGPTSNGSASDSAAVAQP